LSTDVVRIGLARNQGVNKTGAVQNYLF
jgi:hypothetical protein